MIRAKYNVFFLLMLLSKLRVDTSRSRSLIFKSKIIIIFYIEPSINRWHEVNGIFLDCQRDSFNLPFDSVKQIIGFSVISNLYAHLIRSIFNLKLSAKHFFFSPGSAQLLPSSKWLCLRRITNVSLLEQYFSFFH